jgi:hypothetical protein
MVPAAHSAPSVGPGSLGADLRPRTAQHPPPPLAGAGPGASGIGAGTGFITAAAATGGRPRGAAATAGALPTAAGGYRAPPLSRPRTARVAMVPRRAPSPRAQLATRNFAFEAAARQASAGASPNESPYGSPRARAHAGAAWGADAATRGETASAAPVVPAVYGPLYVLRMGNGVL